MSFDLYFCRRQNCIFEPGPLLSKLRTIPRFSIHSNSPEKFQAWYENEETGVYFSLELGPVESEPPEDSPVPTEYLYTGLSFNLNLVRPSFFAREAMPFVERLCDEFQLLVFDPQQPTDETSQGPRKLTKSQLIASWERSNRWVVPAVYGTGDLDEPSYRYYSREKADFWWEYQIGRSALQSHFGNDVWVPAISLLAKERQIYGAVLWSDALPQVFPECDFIIIQKTKKSWFRKTSEFPLTLVPFEVVVQALGSSLREVGGKRWNDLKFVHPDDREAKKTFERMIGEPMDGYNGASSDSFVDIQVPSLLAS